MESVEAPINIHYIIETHVLSVTHEHRTVRTVKGTKPDEWVTEREDMGWYVRFEGSYERMYFGPIEPDVRVGDPVRITIERLPR
jgi:hypothetical protein